MNKAAIPNPRFIPVDDTGSERLAELSGGRHGFAFNHLGLPFRFDRRDVAVNADYLLQIMNIGIFPHLEIDFDSVGRIGFVQRNGDEPHSLRLHLNASRIAFDMTCSVRAGSTETPLLWSSALDAETRYVLNRYAPEILAINRPTHSRASLMVGRLVFRKIRQANELFVPSA
jgi:hypothetical protein